MLKPTLMRGGAYAAGALALLALLCAGLVLDTDLTTARRIALLFHPLSAQGFDEI